MQLPLSKHLTAHIDDEDFAIVEPFTWTAIRTNGRNYALGRMNMPPGYFSVQLHRLILNAGHGEFVQFLDGDGLNCRRSNIRIATQGEIARAAKPSSRPQTSRFKGVCFDRTKNQWRAAIMHKGERIFLGHFESEEAAAVERDRVALELGGEGVFLNGVGS